MSIPSPPGTGTFSLTVQLERGEIYLIAAEADDALANRDGLIGISIESDRPIVVNTGSANGSFHNGGGRDYGIDQMVGADKIGKEYVFVKGNGENGWENVLIVADQDNTDVFLDDNLIPITNLAKAGDYYLIEGDVFSNAGSERTLYVSSSKNVFAWQGTGTGSEANQGMFFVPPLSCQSQGEVNNIPQIDYIGSSLFSGFVTIVTNQTASVTFSDANNTNKSADDSSFSGGLWLLDQSQFREQTTRPIFFRISREMYPLILPMNCIVLILIRMGQQPLEVFTLDLSPLRKPSLSRPLLVEKNVCPMYN
jgi:hypothetical protein